MKTINKNKNTERNKYKIIKAVKWQRLHIEHINILITGYLKPEVQDLFEQ